MHYEIRGVREGDLPYLSRNLRAADVRELYATYGHVRFLETLERSVSISGEALIGAGCDGKPVVLMGIRQFAPESAVVWACGTPEITTYRTPFLRNSRAVLRSWFEQHPGVGYFMNFTHESNTLHHRWLSWCGAELLPGIPWGALGEPFRPFTIRRSALCVTLD